MTQSFDINEYNSRECEAHNHGFYLGAQSRQTEIDELQKRIGDALESINETCNVNCNLAIDDYYYLVEDLENILKGTTNEQ